MESTVRFENLTLPSNTTEQDKNTIKEILQILQTCIHNSNNLIQEFKMIYETDIEIEGKIVLSSKAPNQQHARRYNEQLNLAELRIVTSEEPHDLIVQKRDGTLQTISDLNPNAMRLHFTLLFPDGNTTGWHTNLFQRNSNNKRITPRECYAFQLMQRNVVPSFLHCSHRLFQEFILSGWLLTESQRLQFQRSNQQTLRADKYSNIQAAVNTEEDISHLGRKVLASSFTGGPRWFNAKYEDAMALVREFGKPDLFVTMTTNPEWPEIQDILTADQKPQDRPDVVSRVFNLKLKQILNDLTAGEIFGQVTAYLAVTEWQKRGLPHRYSSASYKFSS